MQTEKCSSCLTAKSTLECGCCKTGVCKSCAQFVEEGQFSYLAKVPEILSHGVYCNTCFSEKVVVELEHYNQTLEQAKNVLVFAKSQGKETRFIRRNEKPVRVENCPDYDEAVLRLAFFAAKANYNAIVDVDLKSEKIRSGSYQTTKWSGTGVPANVNSNKLVKDKSIWDNPN